MAATGQGLLGNNMFNYCHNNPVSLADPTGLCTYVAYEPWKSPDGKPYIDCKSVTCPKSAAFRSYANSVPNADSYSSYVGSSVSTFILDWWYGTPGYGDFAGTFTLGFSRSKTNQTGFGGSGGICIDGKGNVGLVVSGTAIVGTPAGGWSVFGSITNAPSIADLEGLSAQVGGSIPYIGVEIVYFQGAVSGQNHSGVTWSFDLSALWGGGRPTIAEGHVSASYSKLLGFGNVRN